MEVANINFVHNAQGLQGPHRSISTKEPAVVTTQQNGTLDEVKLSDEALRLNREPEEAATQRTGIRFDLVNRVRAEIAAGSYDTADKMDAALSRMLSSF